MEATKGGRSYLEVIIIEEYKTYQTYKTENMVDYNFSGVYFKY